MSSHNGEAGTAIIASSHGDEFVETGNTLSHFGIIPNPDLLVQRDKERLNDLAPKYIGPEYFTIKVYHGGFLQDGFYIGIRHDFYNKFSKDNVTTAKSKVQVHEKVQSPAIGFVHGLTTHTQTQFVQVTSTPFQQTSGVAATQSQIGGTSLNKVEEFRTYKKKSLSKNVV